MYEHVASEQVCTQPSVTMSLSRGVICFFACEAKPNQESSGTLLQSSSCCTLREKGPQPNGQVSGHQETGKGVLKQTETFSLNMKNLDFEV